MSANVMAIIPARAGSRGIPGKNFKLLCGSSPVKRAAECCRDADIGWTIVSSDAARYMGVRIVNGEESIDAVCLPRPADLAQDETPMSAVVAHVLEQVPGPDSQIILLVQPTQPLRQPKHLQAAIALVEANAADWRGCVISVTPTETVDKLFVPLIGYEIVSVGYGVERRQTGRLTYRADGTVYAWRRGAPFRGHPWIKLEIPAEETCPLDSLADWAEAERRLSTR